MACNLDFDGDGTVEKNMPTTGNTLLLYNSSELIAKAINDQGDENVPGDWKVTGRVRYFDRNKLIVIYLIGGS